MKNFIKKILRFFGWKLTKIKIRKPKSYAFGKPELQDFECINSASGILHLGGHRGVEAAAYNWFNKKVLWVEAIPELFNELSDNIQIYYNQNAICALLGDINNKETKFYLSNKDKSCSSVFDLSDDVKNKKLWKEHDVKIDNNITLKMRTLDSVLNENKIDSKDYNHWVMDLQGAELICLIGANQSIRNCKSIHIEISKKNYYDGGANWLEIKKFLNQKGFQVFKEPKNDHDDVLFIKNNLNSEIS
jgi:FkbM family methyltransferase